MSEVLVVLLAFLVTWVAITAIAAVVLRWRVLKANRVSPTVRTPAPLTWLWSPSQAARLHRRLRTVVASMDAAHPRPRRGRGPGAPSLSVEQLRDDLEHQAVVLDHHVVVAARTPKPYRRGELRRLGVQVVTLEELSLRVTALGRASGVPVSGWDVGEGSGAMLDRITTQLDLLDQARAELTAVERGAGLGTPDLDHLLALTQRDPRRELQPDLQREHRLEPEGIARRLSPPPPPPPR